VPVHHEIDADAGLIRVCLSGAVTAAEILAYYADLAADPALRPGLAVLADCRGVTGVPSFMEIGAVATAQARTPVTLRPTRAAVIVATGWLFGIVRQFGALAERTGVRVMPFYAEQDAKNWLVADAPMASELVDSASVSSDRA
jgi:hypothetical protein